MKHLLEITLKDDIKSIYLYDDELNDYTSKRLKSDFIDNIIELSSTEKVIGDSILIFKNIKLDFDFKDFSDFLKNKKKISIIKIYDFFCKNKVSKEILENYIKNSSPGDIAQTFNENSEYYYNLVTGHKLLSQLQNNIIFYDKYFISKNAVAMNFIKNSHIQHHMTNSNCDIYFVDVESFMEKMTPTKDNLDNLKEDKIDVRIYNFKTNEKINAKFSYVKFTDNDCDGGYTNFNTSLDYSAHFSIPIFQVIVTFTKSRYGEIGEAYSTIKIEGNNVIVYKTEFLFEDISYYANKNINFPEKIKHNFVQQVSDMSTGNNTCEEYGDNMIIIIPK